MSQIEVVGGDFESDPRSRFSGTSMVLWNGSGRALRRPGDLVRFRVREGLWARCFEEAGDWSRALGASAIAGAPGAAANLFLPTTFLGQAALITWANAMIGGAAAAAAVKSGQRVLFEVTFAEGARLRARTQERVLMQRLPAIYRALAMAGRK
jgi:hypothetical protein